MSTLLTTQVLGSIITAAVVILVVLVGFWLRAHQKAVDATIASIKDPLVRSTATDVVRWLEQDPQQLAQAGLTQRSNGIAMLTTLLGISTPAATVAIDAAYQGLTLAGQIVHHDPPLAVTPAPVLDVDGAADQIVARVVAALTPTAFSAPAPVLPVTPPAVETPAIVLPATP